MSNHVFENQTGVGLPDHGFEESELPALARDAAYGTGDLVAELFRNEGYPAPEQSWRPTLDEMRLPELAGFYRYVSGKVDVPQRLTADELDRLDLKRFENFLIVLEPNEQADDFLYAHYGDHIAAVRGLDMTGRWVSEFGGHIGVYFRAMYQSVAARKEWLLTKHVPPTNIFAHRWRRLIIPVLNKRGEPKKFLVANLPENELRAGLDRLSSSVVITDAESNVVFANQEAQTVFGELRPGQAGIKLKDYLISDLQDMLDPFDPNEPAVRLFKVKSILADTLVVQYTAIINPMKFRGASYSLLMLVPDL